MADATTLLVALAGVFSLAYERTGNIGTTMVAHALFNLSEPFVVTAPYSDAEQNAPIALSRHAGQELDYVLTGHLRFAYEAGVPRTWDRPAQPLTARSGQRRAQQRCHVGESRRPLRSTSLVDSPCK